MRCVSVFGIHSLSECDWVRTELHCEAGRPLDEPWSDALGSVGFRSCSGLNIMSFEQRSKFKRGCMAAPVFELSLESRPTQVPMKTHCFECTRVLQAKKVVCIFCKNVIVKLCLTPPPMLFKTMPRMHYCIVDDGTADMKTLVLFSKSMVHLYICNRVVGY